MIEKLQLLHPEILLFAVTCVVMLLGLARTAVARRSAALITGLGLAGAAYLGTRSPTGVAEVNLPNILPYAKTVIALVALLILPLLAGTVDRAFETAIEKGRAFDPLRATRGEFYAFFLFSVTGVMLCATADDLIWLFLALELTSLPTYIMVATGSSRLRAQEAGVKYFFLGAFGAAMFLYGFAMLYGATGTTSLPAIWTALSADPNGIPTLALAGVLFSIVGIAFKIAAVPMHFYAADVYQGAAAPVAAYLAFAPKAAGFLALIAILSAVGWRFGPEGEALPDAVRVTLWVMAAATMTIGNALALMQYSVKRMLAYSSVAHSGYIIVGLLAGPGDPTRPASNGLGGALLYLAIYGVMNLGAFAVIACLERENERGERVEAETLDDIAGLCRTHPWLGWSMVICALSLLGFPPLLGFWGKLALFTSGLAAGEYALVVILALNSAIAAWYYLRLATAPLLGVRPPEMHAPTLFPSRARRLAAVLSAAGVIVLIFFVSGMQEAAHRAGLQQTSRLRTDAPPAGVPPLAVNDSDR
ncbi:MAG: NADH-quinone oxidoreductase subunit N [Phycisphaerales bacterium]